MITPLFGAPHIAMTDLAKSVSDIAMAIVLTASILLVALTLKALLTRTRWPQLKKPTYLFIVITVVLTTATLGGLTIFLDFYSPTGGPIRWQAAYQIWACGNQLKLRDAGATRTDRVGTPRLSGRNGLIRVEGIPTKLPEDASLGAFIHAVGGEIADDSLLLPVNDDNAFVGTPSSPELVEPYLMTEKHGTYLKLTNSDRCGQESSQIQTFVNHYSTSAKFYFQTKLDHPANYEIAHASSVPPGDCVIVEFSPPKDRTSHVCTATTSHGAANE